MAERPLKALVLKKQTLRILSDRELSEIAGAASPDRTKIHTRTASCTSGTGYCSVCGYGWTCTCV